MKKTKHKTKSAPTQGNGAAHGAAHVQPPEPTTSSQQAGQAAGGNGGQEHAELVEAKSDAHIAQAEGAARINRVVLKTIEDFMNAGQEIQTVKKAVGHGHFMGYFENHEVYLSLSKAEDLMFIARNKVLANSANWPNLPLSITALRVLAELDEGKLQSAIDHGEVTPELTIEQARLLKTMRQPVNTEEAATPSADVKSNGTINVVVRVDGATPDPTPLRVVAKDVQPDEREKPSTVSDQTSSPTDTQPQVDKVFEHIVSVIVRAREDLGNDELWAQLIGRIRQWLDGGALSEAA